MSIRKAVIPAAGLGTRFLPATKSQPKEMLPVIDKPGIQYVVEEAVRAGLDDILIVTSRGKTTLEDHFDRSLDLEHHLEQVGKSAELDEIRKIGQLADICYVRQKEPRGFGDAVLMARSHVGDSPFVAMVGDEIVPEPAEPDSDLIAGMVRVFEEHGCSVVAVQEVSPEDVSAYGVIAPGPVSGDAAEILDMVEKPAVDEAPSNLASVGRYLFTPDIFDAIESTAAGVGGEVQLTDAIKLLAQQKGAYAYIHTGTIFDVGNKLDYLKASIQLALGRDDLAKPVMEFLQQVTGEPA
ncbi:MAG: UTP--glucose-1-phosphate uridylyltransferase GalU [Actinomycetota bacterium]|nr:UTP--glucose-1-phosphate uridylyltransferase GalU [Actinomycetota bacterium]